MMDENVARAIRDALTRCQSVLYELDKASDELRCRLEPVLTLGPVRDIYYLIGRDQDG